MNHNTIDFIDTSEFFITDEFVYLNTLFNLEYDIRYSDNSFECVLDDMIIGSAAIETDLNTVYVKKLYVIEDYRELGVGTILLDKIESFYKEKGFEKIVINYENVPIEFYSKQGYNELCKDLRERHNS